MGLAFLNPPSTPAGIQSFKTVTFFCQPGYFYLSIILAVFILCEELVVFDREREDNMYKTLPWVASTILSYLPMNAIIPTIYAIIVYFMTGWRRDNLAKNLFSFIAGCIMQQQAAWSLALLCSAVNRSFAQASLLANGQWHPSPFPRLETKPCSHAFNLQVSASLFSSRVDTSSRISTAGSPGLGGFPPIFTASTGKPASNSTEGELLNVLEMMGNTSLTALLLS